MRITIISLITLWGTAFTSCSSGGDQNNSESTLFRLSFDPAVQEKTVVDLINDAQQTIEMSMYGFDNVNIAKAMVNAYQRRGIQVRVSTEFDAEELSGYQTLILAGIPVKLGNTGGIQHNKYLIVDRKYIVTGSTNLKGSKPPESPSVSGMWAHFNNLIAVKNAGLASEFLKDFDVQWAGSYAGAKDAGYTTLYGSTPWPETEYAVGNLKINAYFTPYQDTYPSYRSRFPGDANCSAYGIPDGAASTVIDGVCSNPATTFEYCYDPVATRTIYRHYNADSGAWQCKGASASYNNYRSALHVVISLLRNARKSITCLFFAFTDRVIMSELKKAKARGLNVRVYMDYNQYRSQYGGSGASFIDLRNTIGFVKLVRRANGGLNHHKVLYVDDDTLVSGSMNYSAAAVTSNDENFLLIRNAGSLTADFNREAARIDEQAFLLPPVADDGYYIPTTENPY